LIGEPDGVAISPDGRWLAVSAHGMRAVFVYDRRTPITPATAPRAILRGPMYPHGVCFTPDGEMILVADAGRPMAHAFARRGETWSGIRHTDLAIRVMDDDTYLRGHVNPQEGGPKGIDVDPTGSVVVTTCRHLPLAAFDVGAIRDLCSDTQVDEDEGVAAELVLIEDAWRELHRVRVALSSLRRSRVMRATAPLRSFYRRLSGKA
jgi:DNA-binding beta-propeller fold protein YncE